MKMADETDRYAKARERLRDMAKWYSATLAAFGATLAGGLSFGVIPDLRGDNLAAGIIVGAAVVASILIGISKIQAIFFPKPYSRRKLDDPTVAARLQPYLAELLPRDMPTLADVQEKDVSGTDDEKNRARIVIEKVTSFAAFLDLQIQVRKTNQIVLCLFVIACLGIGYLYYLKDTGGHIGEAGYVSISFSPDADWSALTAALKTACPVTGPVAAEGKADAPFSGWWTIRLKGPQACAGATLSVPAVTVEPGRT
jgi:hypothetical protein